MDFLDALKEQNNFTETENGATALCSTLNSCLDMFASFNSFTDRDNPEVIVDIFKHAFIEDKKAAVKLLFYSRDVRGGQGRRKSFRICMNWLANNYPEYVINNLNNFAEFGRYDDLLCLIDTPLKDKVIEYIRFQLLTDYSKMGRGEQISLLAKWMPSANTSSAETVKYAKIIIKAFGWSEKRYRQTLSLLRKYIDVTERKMSANKWTEIDYSKVPGKASINYGNAFERHDEEGYTKYIMDVIAGKAKVNAGALYPYDIVHEQIKTDGSKTLKCNMLDAAWKSLPNYFEGREETGICVVDVSGSMTGTPMEVALSLGLYCADKCAGPFKNHFITFSHKPILQEIKGENLYEKLNGMVKSDWGMDTDIEAVFKLILTTAINNNCTQADLPKKLYIISDMQFNDAIDDSYEWREEEKSQTFMKKMKEQYAEAGYEMPSLIYWNVRASGCGMFQDTFDGENCCMVSGFSPSLFKAIIEGTEYEKQEDGSTKEKLDPMTIMNTVLNSERYQIVWVG